MRKLTTTLALFALCGAAAAKDFNYTYIEVGYWDRTDVIDVGLSDDDVENDGYSVRGSYRTEAGLLMQLTARVGESDKLWGQSPASGADTDLEAYGVFIGGANQHSADLSVWAGLGYERQDISLPRPGLSMATGFSNLDTTTFGGGVRYWVIPMVELNAGLAYQHIKGKDGLRFSDNDVQTSLGVRFQPVDMFSVGANVDYRVDSGTQAVSADVRLQF